MSDPEITETTTPTEPPRSPEAPSAAETPRVASAATNGDAPVDGVADGDGTTLTPAKRRRRGRRGGRNRRRPAGTGGQGQGASRDADDSADDDLDGPDDWTDAEADRGLTTEDVAAKAMEEAGISGTPSSRSGGPRPAPKIGDSRPAPAPTPASTANTGDDAADGDGAPKKRRRRRGGRGRNKSANGGGAATGERPQRQAQRPGDYVDALTEIGSIDVDGTEILENLDPETLERRRGATRKGRPAGRYLMVVHARPDGMSHLAVLEGRHLVDHYVSVPQDDATSIDGNIYYGKVQNVLPGMEAAFIDIGTPKNGVLYRSDVLYDPSEMEGGEKPRIEKALRNGQSIIVQVTKNPIAHKGARLTQEVSLAGRFVVMVPGQPQTYGISKRLPDDERKRLRRVLDRLRPADAGLIVRTAAEGAAEEELERDMRRLKLQWQQISDLAKRAKPGSLLYKEPPLVIRIIREEFTKEYRGIVIDDRTLYEEVRAYLDAVAPELAERVEYYDADAENLPIFEKFHIHEQLHKALDRKVWLPSGGSVVIEATEALTVIDVNTGKNVGSSNLEETVYRNNLEAADVIARELRLRDIGGIIVIDFIDMESKKNREAVENAFRDALARDKTRTQVFPISELGLLEMTRKRVSEGLVEMFSDTCPTCHGRGLILDESMLE
ncbi:MAG TPA: Rne/Rng family ribonuclease [Acidimicrobiia bacterium]|nr:Rne/Rng family ribonuclease [Acidimicrobiia bacterium]